MEKMAAPIPSWLDLLFRTEKTIYNVEKAICALSLFLMLVAVAVTVLFRNLGLAILNYGELGLAAMVPLTAVGGAMCTYLGSHISVEIVGATSSRVLKRTAGFFVALATILFACFYLYSSFILVKEFRATGDKLLDLGTPLWILTFLFGLGMLLLILHSALWVAKIWWGTDVRKMELGE